MTQFRKKPVVVEAITFEELVAHGLTQASPVAHGMPWSFDYKGHPITHENDDCYLIPTLEGTMRFNRGEMLVTGVKGEIYPCKADIFAATYEPAAPDSPGGDGEAISHEDARDQLRLLEYADFRSYFGKYIEQRKAELERVSKLRAAEGHVYRRRIANQRTQLRDMLALRHRERYAVRAYLAAIDSSTDWTVREDALEALRCINRGQRPDSAALPGYHDLLHKLCEAFGVPGSPTFDEALASIKAELAGYASAWISMGVKPKYGYDDADCDALDRMAARYEDPRRSPGGDTEHTDPLPTERHSGELGTGPGPQTSTPVESSHGSAGGGGEVTVETPARPWHELVLECIQKVVHEPHDAATDALLDAVCSMRVQMMRMEAPTQSPQVYRCKRVKTPGDGGVVDGCGWQGTLANMQDRDGQKLCPLCGSSRFGLVKS